jgi:exonuclease SbcD
MVLSAVADLVTEHQVDVVIVAGDVYDRAVPSAEAIEVCTKAFSRIRAAGAELVVTSGNHDSASRLGANDEFAALGGLHLRTRIAQVGAPVLLEDDHGPVAFYGLPYLEPETSRHTMEIPEARGHAGVLREAMRRVRADLASRPANIRSFVAAHAFVVGGAPSESERTIAVGGVETVPANVFDGVDYVALGHLHGPQILTPRVRYSGSPLAYSFGERRHRKSVWLVEVDSGGLAEVQRVELPIPRRLSELTGELDDLLADPAYDTVLDHYLSVTVTDAVRPLDPLRRLQERFPHTVQVRWQCAESSPTRYADRIRGRSDAEIVSSFLEDVRGAGPTNREQEWFERAHAELGPAL